ncbi:DUF938 domain-containing protein [Colwelliaceae bacterium 6441]
MALAFSQACENNKKPIFSILKNVFSQTKTVLEIGSGTGQHALYLAEKLPHLIWQTSDLAINHATINERIDGYQINNIRRPLLLDLNEDWPLSHKEKCDKIDGIFTANTLHIASWPMVKQFFEGVATHLEPAGILCIYGPFNYDGKFTSESNANFELWLKDRDENSGIRDFEAVMSLALLANLSLVSDNEMPANNRLLVFEKM